MKNFEKRVLTSLIVFPLSIFFILKGGYYIVSFLYAILILGNYEVFSAFKKKNDSNNFRFNISFITPSYFEFKK